MSSIPQGNDRLSEGNINNPLLRAGNLPASSPYLVDLGAIGSSSLGYLTVAEHNKNIPFEVKRVYWTYFTPNEVTRGQHAHRELEQIIVAVSGQILVETEGRGGQKLNFTLANPRQGLFIPRLHWRTLRFSHNAVLLCLASMEYSAEDYIRSYEEFQSFVRQRSDATDNSTERRNRVLV